MTKFYFSSKSTPNTDPEAVMSSVPKTKLLAAINSIDPEAISAVGVNTKDPVVLGSIINPACIDSVTIEQLTKEVTEAVLNISFLELPSRTPSILKYAVVVILFDNSNVTESFASKSSEAVVLFLN